MDALAQLFARCAVVGTECQKVVVPKKAASATGSNDCKTSVFIIEQMGHIYPLHISHFKVIFLN